MPPGLCHHVCLCVGFECFYLVTEALERDLLVHLLGWGQLSFSFLPFAHISAQPENSLLFHLVDILCLPIFYKNNYFFSPISTLKGNIIFMKKLKPFIILLPLHKLKKNSHTYAHIFICLQLVDLLFPFYCHFYVYTCIYIHIICVISSIYKMFICVICMSWIYHTAIYMYFM